MFCPKCGLHNPDDSIFCRGCGVDLSHVLAVVDGRMPMTPDSSEKQVELFSSGVRNIVLAFCFFIFSLLVFTIPGDTYFWVLVMIPGFPLFASGVSRILRSNGLKAMSQAGAISQRMIQPSQLNVALPAAKTEYIKPSQSNYQTDDLAAVPSSVTEETTRHLQMDKDCETMTMPKAK